MHQTGDRRAFQHGARGHVHWFVVHGHHAFAAEHVVHLVLVLLVRANPGALMQRTLAEHELHARRLVEIELAVAELAVAGQALAEGVEAVGLGLQLADATLEQISADTIRDDKKPDDKKDDKKPDDKKPEDADTIETVRAIHGGG